MTIIEFKRPTGANGHPAAKAGETPPDILSKKEIRARLRQMGEIELMIANCRQAWLSPRAHRAAAWAAGVSGVFAVTVQVLSRFGVQVSNPVSGAVLVAIACTFIVAYRRTRRPASWVRALDDALTAYDPLDRDAYADLQGALRARGRFDLMRIQRWLHIEHTAIDMERDRARQYGYGHKFMSKKID